MRYALHRSTVRSQHDGDAHRISAPELARLYGLADGQWVEWREGMDPGQYAHLYAREDGRYELPIPPPKPTTTTPDSRARIAYTAWCRTRYDLTNPLAEVPTYDELPELERAAWLKSANVIWDLATTGHATL